MSIRWCIARGGQQAKDTYVNEQVRGVAVCDIVTMSHVYHVACTTCHMHGMSHAQHVTCMTCHISARNSYWSLSDHFSEMTNFISSSAFASHVHPVTCMYCTSHVHPVTCMHITCAPCHMHAHHMCTLSHAYTSHVHPVTYACTSHVQHYTQDLREQYSL